MQHRRSLPRALATALVLGLLATLLAPLAASALPSGQPENLAPDSTTVTENPVLTWDALPGAARYKVQASTDPAFGTFKVNVTTYNTTYAPVVELPTGTTYWRVAGMDATGTATGTFTNAEFEKELAGPTQLTPSDTATIGFPSETPSFSWTALPAVESYELWIDDAEDFIGATKVTTESTSYTLTTTQTLDQVFYWQVRGNKDGILTEWSDVWEYDIQWDAAPVLVAPEFSEGDPLPTVTDIVLEWEPVVGAKSYDLEVALDEDFITFPSGGEVSDINGTVWSPNTTFDNDDYFWRVRSRDVDGHIGPWSEVWQFRRQWLDAPTLLSPEEDEDLDVIEFEWTSVPHASHYEFQIGTDENFSPSTFDTCKTVQTRLDAGTSTGTFTCSATVPEDYYWRVRAIDAPKASPTMIGIWSEIRHSGATFAVPSIDPFDPSTLVTQTSPANCIAEGCAHKATPTMMWDPVAGAEYYLVTVALDANFTTEYKTFKVTGQTQFTPREEYDDNSAGQAYYWHVRPCDADAAPDLCGPDPEGTINPPSRTFKKVSVPVELTAPTNGDVLPNQPTFSWTPYLETTEAAANDPDPDTTDLDARQYFIQVSTVNTFASTIDSATVDQTTYTPETLTYPEGPIYWRVRAIDGSQNDLQWSETRTFTKTSPQVERVTPEDGESVGGAPTFSWTPQEFAASYVFEIYKNNDVLFSPANKVLTVTTEQARFTLTDALPVGTYTWRIRREDSDSRDGPWSSPAWSFTSTGDAPTLLAPDNDALFTTDDLVFSWEAVDGAAKYKFQRSTTLAFTTVAESVTTVMTQWAPITHYTDGSVYWRVQALDTDGDVLGTSEIRRIIRDTTAPTVEAHTPTSSASITGPFEVTFSENVDHVDETGFTIHRKGSATLINTTVSQPADDMARLVPDAPLVPGETYVLDITDVITDENGTEAVPFTWEVRTNLEVENSSPVVKETWDRDPASGDSGGYHKEARVSGASIAFSFTGEKASVTGRKAKDGGYANIYVDGQLKASNVSLYSSTTKLAVLYTTPNLVAGSHVLSVVVRGTHPSGSTGNWVRIDKFTSGGITYQENSSHVTDKFNRTVTSAAHGGSQDKIDHVADSAGTPKFTMTFKGTGVDWYSAKAISGGKADVYIDGVKKATIDLYRSTTAYKQKVFSSATLTNGTHTIEVRPLGTKNASSSGYNVWLDYFKAR